MKLKLRYKVLLAYIVAFLAMVGMAFLTLDLSTDKFESDSAFVSAMYTIGTIVIHFVNWIVATWLVGSVLGIIGWIYCYLKGLNEMIRAFKMITLLNAMILLSYLASLID